MHINEKLVCLACDVRCIISLESDNRTESSTQFNIDVLQAGIKCEDEVLRPKLFLEAMINEIYY